LADRINDVMETPMKYRERGQTKVATRRELSLVMLVDQAAKGDISAAEAILNVRQRAERHGGAGVTVVQVENWLPDYPGQTAEEKAKATQDKRHAEPIQPEE
jgi:hypothetical protein